MPYVVDDGVHCARCGDELNGSECTAFGCRVCTTCGQVFKEMSRQVPEWGLYNVYFSYDKTIH